jgi:hypothetical protein
VRGTRKADGRHASGPIFQQSAGLDPGQSGQIPGDWLMPEIASLSSQFAAIVAI